MAVVPRMMKSAGPGSRAQGLSCGKGVPFARSLDVRRHVAGSGVDRKATKLIDDDVFSGWLVNENIDAVAGSERFPLVERNLAVEFDGVVGVGIVEQIRDDAGAEVAGFEALGEDDARRGGSIAAEAANDSDAADFRKPNQPENKGDDKNGEKNCR